MKLLVSSLAILALAGCSETPKPATEQMSKATATGKPDALVIEPSDVETRTPKQFHGPRDALAEGRLAVDIMEVVASARVNELALRLQEAARSNPDWWLSHLRKSKPGEPLPYDARTGLSIAEYNEFLESRMTTQKKAQATLLVESSDVDVYVLNGGQALSDFTGIEIDLQDDVVRTPFGSLTERSTINAPETSALGAWVGVQWKLVESDANRGTHKVASFAVGQLKLSGRCVIYYDVRRASPDGKSRISHVLNYDLVP